MAKLFDREQVASYIAEAKSDILRAWENSSREQVPAAKEQSRLALRDSLPKFMDQLVETLRSPDARIEKEKNSAVAREHGEDRAKLPEYTLPELILEYHILRAVVIESLENGCPPDFLSRKIVHEFIDRGISDATVRYCELESSYQFSQRAELQAARDEADRATQAKSAFLANMSHEIRTPLGAIMGFVSLLRETVQNSAEGLKYLDIVDRNSHHLLRIIDDILDLTKVESGKMAIEKVEFSLLELIADFSSLTGIKAREKGLTFCFKAETMVPEYIISDSVRIRQALSNIVGNAIKFTERGYVELTVGYNDNHLEFKVKDTGRGISGEQRSVLFQAFSQADVSTTRKFGGAGLGLVIAKKLSQALGGDFDLIESEVGVGSVFEMSIPVEIPAKANLVPIKDIKVSPFDFSDNGMPWAEKKPLDILIVEDSPDNQFLIQTIIRKIGAKVSLARDGSQGVRMALEHPYDVILMDIQMPVMDGHEAVRILREKGYQAPIVALTAHAMKEESARAKKSGFSHFLTKPIHSKSLLDLLLQLSGDFVVIK